MPTPNLNKKHMRALLLQLLNLLADFDGEISEDAVLLLNELQQREAVIPPLYADVFGLPDTANCRDLVDRIHTLSQEQRAVASYAFQIFRTYEHLLAVNTNNRTIKQQQVCEAQ